MTLGLFTWLGLTILVFISASAALKSYAIGAGMAALLAALLLYTAGNLMMVRLMRASGMAVAISVSAVLQLVFANLVAIALFGERPSAMQAAGIVLGIAAVALILVPTTRSG